MTFLRDLDGHQALGLCIERLVDYGLPALAQLMMHLWYFSIVKSVSSVVGIAYVSVWTLLIFTIKRSSKFLRGLKTIFSLQCVTYDDNPTITKALPAITKGPRHFLPLTTTLMRLQRLYHHNCSLALPINLLAAGTWGVGTKRCGEQTTRIASRFDASDVSSSMRHDIIPRKGGTRTAKINSRQFYFFIFMYVRFSQNLFKRVFIKE